MVQIENVSFGYAAGSKTLHNISFSAKKGECILLCGESGCGKTTVTKLINGLIPYFTEGCNLKGTAKAAGLSTSDTELYELAKHIGSVFQNPKSQFFNLDTDSEIAFGLENEGVDPEYMKKRLNTVIKNLQIEKLIGRKIFSLSGGEKQTLAFASVYAMDPEIYVLDEPTANLDVEAIERLREQIILLKKQGRTVLIAEHRLYFIADLIGRALYFRSGQIAESFSGEEFQNLSENKRKELGLRTLNQPTISLPKARAKDDSVWNECEQAAGEIINRAEIESVLKKFDLLRLKEQHPMALSGGQKQRLAVATAMLSNKKLLIFDEPTSGLDYRHMRAVSAVIRNLAEQGHIILVVSHDNEFMTEACDRVLGI